MSKIDELIKRFSPDGVECKTIQDVCKNIVSGGTPSTSKADYYNGNIPWLRTQEVDWIDIYDTGIKITESGLKNSSAKLIPENCVIVAMYGATAAKVAVNKIPLSTNQACCNLEIDEKVATYRYVYYWLCNSYNHLRSLGEGSQSNINGQKIKSYKIPVPPLEIQNEIVSILDKFTLLEAELEARQKQYEHYRDAMLRFEAKNVEWKTLGEMGEFTRGKRFVKTDILSEGFPCIHYGEMYTHYKIWAKEAKSFLDPTLATKLRVAKPGDVVIVAAGETIEDIGQGLAWLGDSDVVIHDACFAYSHNMHPNYVSHFLQTDLFHSQIKRHISSGKISAINASGLSKAKIPVPPIEEQKRIASILDKFHLLINDISIGIPAEIDGRRKQYEYYRNKLLTFRNRSNG
ncbi:MAG: restriction endonuclease subunit S [Chitinophagaceae bacterium]|nr:MAG: restriction endonuclease subunit S [Chitinophagaceae bacterium]